MSNSTNTKLSASMRDIEHLINELIEARDKAKLAAKRKVAEVTRYRRMLYTMTSRVDWQQAGYDVAEYDALVEEFEGEDKP